MFRKGRRRDRPPMCEPWRILGEPAGVYHQIENRVYIQSNGSLFFCGRRHTQYDKTTGATQGARNVAVNLPRFGLIVCPVWPAERPSVGPKNKGSSKDRQTDRRRFFS